MRGRKGLISVCPAHQRHNRTLARLEDFNRPSDCGTPSRYANDGFVAINHQGAHSLTPFSQQLQFLGTRVGCKLTAVDEKSKHGRVSIQFCVSRYVNDAFNVRQTELLRVTRVYA